MTDELKPVKCGCGGEAQILHPSYTHCIVVMCGKCGIKTPYMNSEAEAITAWNRAMGADQFRDLTKKIERTAKVETVEKPNVYKCSECGQYFHSTAWAVPLNTVHGADADLFGEMKMSDLISREDAIAKFKKSCTSESIDKNGIKRGEIHTAMTYEGIIKIIESLPSAESERRKGKWKNVALFTRECSECGAQFHELEYDNFCPNCGADMRGDR